MLSRMSPARAGSKTGSTEVPSWDCKASSICNRVIDFPAARLKLRPATRSDPASAAWWYGGCGRSRWSGRGDTETGWHDSPISYGELGRIQLELPDGGQRSVPAVRLDPFGAAVWLSDTPSGDELSASLAWFAALTGFAVRMVGNRRVTPVVVTEGPFTVAHGPYHAPPAQLHTQQLAGLDPRTNPYPFFKAMIEKWERR